MTAAEYRDHIQRYTKQLRRFRLSSSLRERNALLESNGTADFRRATAPYMPFTLLIGPATITHDVLSHTAKTVQTQYGPAFEPTMGVSFGSLTLEGSSGNLETIYEEISDSDEWQDHYLKYLGGSSQFEGNAFPDLSDSANNDFLERFYRYMATLVDSPSVKRRTYQLLKEWNDEPLVITSTAETFVNRKTLSIISPLYPYGKTFVGWTTGLSENVDSEQYRQYKWSLSFQIVQELKNDFILNGGTGGSVSFDRAREVDLQRLTINLVPEIPAPPPVTQVEIPPPVIEDKRLVISTSNVGLSESNVSRMGSARFSCPEHGDNVVVNGTGESTRYDLTIAVTTSVPVENLDDVGIIPVGVNPTVPTVATQQITSVENWPTYGGDYIEGNSWLVKISSLPPDSTWRLTFGVGIVSAEDPNNALAENTVVIDCGGACPPPPSLRLLRRDQISDDPCARVMKVQWIFSEPVSMSMASVRVSGGPVDLNASSIATSDGGTTWLLTLNGISPGQYQVALIPGNIRSSANAAVTLPVDSSVSTYNTQPLNVRGFSRITTRNVILLSASASKIADFGKGTATPLVPGTEVKGPLIVVIFTRQVAGSDKSSYALRKGSFQVNASRLNVTPFPNSEDSQNDSNVAVQAVRSVITGAGVGFWEDQQIYVLNWNQEITELFPGEAYTLTMSGISQIGCPQNLVSDLGTQWSVIGAGETAGEIGAAANLSCLAVIGYSEAVNNLGQVVRLRGHNHQLDRSATSFTMNLLFDTPIDDYQATFKRLSLVRFGGGEASLRLMSQVDPTTMKIQIQYSGFRNVGEGFTLRYAYGPCEHIPLSQNLNDVAIFAI